VLLLGASPRSAKEVGTAVGLFVALGLANAVDVLVSSATVGKRVFGFAGIVFVDFAVIIALVLVNYAVFARGRLRFWSLPAAILTVVALFLTQTRNVLIGLAVAGVIYGIYLYVNSRALGLRRSHLVFIGLSVLVAAGGIAVGTLAVFPQAFGRIADLAASGSTTITTEADFALNSVVSRLLIWTTAWNGFLAHPIVGIGAFSFPFASVEYNMLPPVLLKNFVLGASPHVTYLAVLVETGIVGFIGFLIFLGTAIRTGHRLILRSADAKDRLVTTTLFVIQVYIAVSMTYTDAWLWGQCGMLWGLLVGLSAGTWTRVALPSGERP
jgi:O-antigen ligase